MSLIIIAVNLGSFKAFRVSEDPFELESAKVELIRSHDVTESRMRISEKARDQAGRFYQGGGTGATESGFGEQHGIKLETEKRLVKLLSDDINTLITEENCDKWYLAAGKNLNGRLVESLLPMVREKLKKNVTADLTWADKTKIMDNFE